MYTYSCITAIQHWLSYHLPFSLSVSFESKCCKRILDFFFNYKVEAQKLCNISWYEFNMFKAVQAVKGTRCGC